MGNCSSKALQYALEVVDSSIAALEFTTAYTYALIASKVLSDHANCKKLIKILRKSERAAISAGECSDGGVIRDFATKFGALADAVSASEICTKKSFFRGDSCKIM